MFIGKLDTLNKKMFGNGLYGENVYLTGSLITRTGEGKYAGINTLNAYSATQFENEDSSPIIFWAGAEDNTEEEVQSALFQVTQNGSLYATRAKFVDSVIAGSSITGADIYAARIHGIGDQYGLEFYDSTKGIAFYNGYKNNTEGPLPILNGQLIFSIDQNGFFTREDCFIKIDDDCRQVTVKGKFNNMDIVDDENEMNLTCSKINSANQMSIDINGESNLILEEDSTQVTSKDVLFSGEKFKLNYQNTDNGWNLYIKEENNQGV